MSVELDKALAAKSDQLNADDLIGADRVIKITKVDVKATSDQPIAIRFEGDDNKPWKPSKTQGRIMKGIWGGDENKWVGKHVMIYREPTVKWAGQEVGGIFIKAIEGIDKPTKLMLRESSKSKKPITVQPLDMSGVSKGETPEEVDTTPILKEARAAANKGKEVFAEWWRENPDKRTIANNIIEELKGLTAKAETPEPLDDEVPM